MLICYQNRFFFLLTSSHKVILERMYHDLQTTLLTLSIIRLASYSLKSILVCFVVLLIIML